MPTIFHLDLDAFFVSVERILDPSLEGKPVIVGGDPHGRGVVAACSYEARAFGLRSGMPIHDAFRLCPKGIYLHGHGKEYSRYSKAVKNILDRYAPIIEQASIDEFYMDFSGCEKIYGNPYYFASLLQAEIKKELSLPCSIGIASNKYVAKISSDYAKPEGITYVVAGQEQEFLAPLPIETMPGIGKVTTKQLNARGFRIIKDITNASSDYFTTLFGKYGIAIYEHAQGKGSEFLTVERERKSIGREETFQKDISEQKVIEDVLFHLVEDVANSLRKKGWMTKTITLKLRYSDFITITRAQTIKEPSNSDKIIFNTVTTLFRNAYKRRVSIRLIGVQLTNFYSSFEQENLFDGKDEKEKRMLQAIDALRLRYGMDIVHYGAVE
ncbi:MAG: DNA polymerase IV [Ignavibacteria bacterium CG_4_8_14_3_um_filter_37_9]|nr:DNA polymerase IV [Ignavibacteria bacterium]PIP77120.1 MAG: DNA polymerase IV [Ignavibacteria bacterium CG22_combo_CG10-13_8_21_14_all_37_15]PIW99304.1 MAG: DNA polymerase IV [Ignavibacteria bacterium CG_4_8_14_3_um_filter_37_9]